MRKIVAGAALLAFGLVACGGGGGEGNGGGSGAPETLEPAAASGGCGAVVKHPLEGQTHTDDSVKYKTTPPTSGDHRPRWAQTGPREKPVPNETQVHNLEHGHVVIQYVPGKVDAAVLDGLIDLVTKDPAWTIIAPRPADQFAGSDVLAFTAWRTLQTCSAPTADTVGLAESFIKKFKRKGPETIPGIPASGETPPRS